MKTRFKKTADTCSICFELIDIQGKLNCCSHLFCFQCIKKWSKSENSCPICKDRFQIIKKVPKRKEYCESKKSTYCVEEKNQNKFVSRSELFLMLEAASNMLSSELRNLLETSLIE